MTNSDIRCIIGKPKREKNGASELCRFHEIPDKLRNLSKVYENTADKMYRIFIRRG